MKGTVWCFWVFWVTSVSHCFLSVFKIQMKCDRIWNHHLLLPVGSVATWVSISLWRGWRGATWPVDGVSRRRRRRVFVSWSLPWYLWTRAGTEMRYCSSTTPPSVSHSDLTTTLMRETRYNRPLTSLSTLRFCFISICWNVIFVIHSNSLDSDFCNSSIWLNVCKCKNDFFFMWKMAYDLRSYLILEKVMWEFLYGTFCCFILSNLVCLFFW